MSLIDTMIKSNSCICKVNQNRSSALASEPTNPFGGGELESLDCSWAASCLERVSEGEEEEEEWLRWAQTCTSESLLQRRRDSDMRLHALLLLGVCWLNGSQLATSQSSQSENRQLTRAVGQSVTFQSPVTQQGYLKYGESKTTLASVSSGGAFTVLVSGYAKRVTWDNVTGFFTITALISQDTGVYTVERKGEQPTVEFRLTVYDRVSRPQVSRVSQVSESCSLLCSVSNGREVTLSWQREGETLTNTSNPDLNTPLTLPLETEGLSHSYSCVASNPVSTETLPVRPEEHCFDRVSKPQINRGIRVSESCSLLCSVSNGREVTLSWQREGETLTNTSNPDLNTPLTLPLETEGLSHSYSCVASNPVSTETLPVRPEEHCFDRVSKPQVNRGIRVSDRCSLLCSVSNGREVTLSWQREGETLSHTSNPDLNTPLTLPLETEGLSHSYSCVASNPVSTETLPVRPEEHCFDRVSKPQINRGIRVSESCSLLCSVSNGREVTLSWQREGETLTNTSNPDLNTPLTLPLETEGLSHSYSCVASNPVSTETLPVRPEEHCFDRVSKPQVSRVSQGSESCSLLCSVSNGREVTLSWQREGETLNHTSNPDLNTPLTLPLETEGLSHSYSCVASNPVSTETLPVRPEDHCFGADDRVLLYAGAAGGGAVCLGIVALVLYCRLRGKKPRDEDSSPSNTGAQESRQEEVTYANLDMKRWKPRAVPPAGEVHTVYAEVTGGGKMQGSHFAPEPPPAAGTLASECTEYARVNFRRKTRRAQDAVLYY
ncbi:neural cell adhesion molecule 1-like isoform X2 [Lepisosteus oculatus]|uniref:neural cell adhesion molecule 1-like isoform X2 n=1 Tax=Lepisosteus oculatus TaxID=7918 RepID=UPI0037214F94